MLGDLPLSHRQQERCRHVGLSCAQEFVKMFEQANRAMGPLAVRPGLALFNKAIADEEIPDRYVEDVADGKIANERNPK